VSTTRFDDAVAGAGIIGLAHAYHLARRGRKVIVFERDERALGASVRNFGMLWPIGQPAGPHRRMAMRSREIWLDLLGASGLWHDRCGSLHLAYRDEEAQVLTEFASMACNSGFECEQVEATGVRKLAPMVRAEGLQLGLFSPWETCVDPREVIAGLPRWLEAARGIVFEFGTAVTGFDGPRVTTARGDWSADRLWVCAGDDFRSLYPEVFRDQGLSRCKLQMMRAELVGGSGRIGPMLAGGLTLRHYKAFEGCPSLSSLRARVARENPELDRYGIHVMVAQNGRGEVVIGDSHEYDQAIEPFDKPEIDALILNYLRSFLDADLRITSRWHGTYAKHPVEPYFRAFPAPGVTAVTATGGAGMTLSFGLAEQVVNEVLGGD
jgi:FAD dependent oxidoreductase TIGR03364